MIKTKRWNEPIEPDDGYRVLICRYRPRALPKAKETWDVWIRDLGPSPELFDSFKGKKGKKAITIGQYRKRYLKEMESQEEAIGALAERVDRGETITLLCSKDCFDPEKCHRTFLAELIEASRSA